MAIQKKYSGTPLQFDHTPEVRETIRKIADAEGVSQAAVLRSSIRHADLKRRLERALARSGDEGAQDES